MSRTVKTRPFWVRMADSHDKAVGAVAVHNHIDRDCDLPEKTYFGIANQNHYGCHYDFSAQGVNVCGCKMCTGQDERKHKTRVNRQNRHQMNTKLLKDISYEEEIVYPTPKGLY